ncbi:MAG: TonB-dependent receptor plug domain-containing protein [Ignavibacteriaceae bacterium]|nr:TonB-dependent receptor plug domain-containing protein [Ignavibacteriaceae bacterium]
MFLKSAITILVFFHFGVIAQNIDSADVFQSTNIQELVNHSEGDSLGQGKDSLSLIESQPAIDTLLSGIDSSAVSLTDSSVAFESDSLIYLNQQPLMSSSTFISRTNILRNDYRNTADILKIFPFTFERSYGFIGQPNDVLLYGVESMQTNYLVDGVPVSFLYSLDFNQFQSEDIDSIEIVSLPRGFLMGHSANSVAVNFISKNTISSQPYSRIKYYEGPFGEAFIDGSFTLKILNDLIVSTDITNRKVDDSFKNSAFSIWQFNSKIKYHLSNEINFIANYYFTKSLTSINGGVNVEEYLGTDVSINALLANETLSPVNYENNSLGFKQHNFGLKILAQAFNGSYTNLDLYYKFYQTEYTAIDSLADEKNTGKDKIWGVNLNQKFSFNPLDITIHAGYKALKHDSYYASSDSLSSGVSIYDPAFEYNSYFISPIITLNLLDSLFFPSVYFKAASLNYKGSLNHSEIFNYSGFGGDIALYLSDQLNFYFGYSQIDQTDLTDKAKLLELKILYKSDFDNISASLFNKKSNKINFWGVGVTGSYLIWKILLEARLSKYFIEDGSLVEPINIPSIKINTGIYYRDYLFNSNLDLKCGFILNYTGTQKLRNFEIPYLKNLSIDVESWTTVDFTLSAAIQKYAIVYFTWENLFDWVYYITPFYPMPERNIRFGIAWEIFN